MPLVLNNLCKIGMLIVDENNYCEVCKTNGNISLIFLEVTSSTVPTSDMHRELNCSVLSEHGDNLTTLVSIHINKAVKIEGNYTCSRVKGHHMFTVELDGKDLWIIM